MHPADTPSIILWENLGYSKRQRCCRIIIISAVAIGLVLLDTVAIAYIRSWNKQITGLGSDATCTAEKQSKFCVCKTLLFKALLDGKEIHKALASKDSCKNFVKEYLFSSLLLVIVPFIVVIVNLVSQKVLSVLSSYEKQPTVS